MKKKNVYILAGVLSTAVAIIAIMFFSPKAQAEGGYVGVSGGYIDTEITNHMAVNLHGGYSFNEFLSIEGRVLSHSSEEGYRGASVEIDSLYGVYIMGSVPISDDISIYALFGHSRAEATASYNGYSETVDDNSSSVGFGVKYDLLEAWSVRLEHTEIMDDIDMTQATITLNF